MKRNKNGNLERMPAIYTKSKPRSVQSFTDLNKKGFHSLAWMSFVTGFTRQWNKTPMDDGIVISNTWLENMVVWKLEEDGTITSSSADLSLMAAKKNRWLKLQWKKAKF